MRDDLPKSARGLTMIPHEVQITSFGGCGTTMLIQFLQEQSVLVPGEPDSGIWKHLPAPPVREEYAIPDHFRAIYLVADPVDALLSVFRRGCHMWHAVRMQSSHRWPARFELRDCPHKPSWGIREFIDVGRDCYGLNEQFLNWTTCPFQERGYPIMILKYESLWNHLNDLCSFVGLPTDVLSRFPPRRGRQEREVVSGGSSAGVERTLRQPSSGS